MSALPAPASAPALTQRTHRRQRRPRGAKRWAEVSALGDATQRRPSLPMRFFVLTVLYSLSALGAVHAGTGEDARWRQRAANVRIVRDDWGIAHVYGKSDADAVFGMIYAQAEDDFARIERNYLNGLGLLAQAEGESAVYSDLRQRLFIDPYRLREKYR